MENASKALIIAGAILIALMIISLSVFMFNKLKDNATEAVDMTEEQISAFNSKITPYFGNAVQGSKVNSLLQYCLSVNMTAKKAGETYKYITVTYPVGSTTKTLDGASTSYDRVSTANTFYKVKCTSYENGLIHTIEITK